MKSKMIIKRSLVRISAAAAFIAIAVGSVPAQAAEGIGAVQSSDSTQLNSQNAGQLEPVFFTFGIDFGYGYADSNESFSNLLDLDSENNTHTSKGSANSENTNKPDSENQELRGWSTSEDQIYSGNY